MQSAKKETLLFVCGQCGFESRKWLGRCPGCGAWDSLAEAHATRGDAEMAKALYEKARALSTRPGEP